MSDVATTGQDFLPMQSSAQMVTTDPAAIAAAEMVKAQIQTVFFMAYQRPRNQADARARIIQACQRTGFAEKAEYAKPVGGGKKVVGPSVRFAEEALRQWGNAWIKHQVVFEDDEMRRSQVTCIDLETNMTYSKEVCIKKTVERKNKKGREVVRERINTYGEAVYVVLATEEEMRTKEASEISKGVRNEGLRIIPADIVEEALVECRKTLRSGDKKDPKGQLKRMCDVLMSVGVMPADIEKYLKHPLDKITPDEIQDLRGAYAAISGGETSWTEFIDGNDPNQSAQQSTDDMAKKITDDLKAAKGGGTFDDDEKANLEPGAGEDVPDAADDLIDYEPGEGEK